MVYKTEAYKTFCFVSNFGISLVRRKQKNYFFDNQIGA